MAQKRIFVKDLKGKFSREDRFRDKSYKQIIYHYSALAERYTGMIALAAEFGCTISEHEVVIDWGSGCARISRDEIVNSLLIPEFKKYEHGKRY